MTTNEMPVVEVLRKAREGVRDHWHKLQGDDPRACCTATAISQVLDASPAGYSTAFANECRLFLQRAIGLDSSAPDMALIWQWNDAPERTHAEVLEAFDKAIALAEQTK